MRPRESVIEMMPSWSSAEANPFLPHDVSARFTPRDLRRVVRAIEALDASPSRLSAMTLFADEGYVTPDRPSETMWTECRPFRMDPEPDYRLCGARPARRAAFRSFSAAALGRLQLVDISNLME